MFNVGEPPPDLFTRPLSTDVTANKVWRGRRDDCATRHCGPHVAAQDYGWSGILAEVHSNVPTATAACDRLWLAPHYARRKYFDPHPLLSTYHVSSGWDQVLSPSPLLSYNDDSPLTQCFQQLQMLADHHTALLGEHSDVVTLYGVAVDRSTTSCEAKK